MLVLVSAVHRKVNLFQVNDERLDLLRLLQYNYFTYITTGVFKLTLTTGSLSPIRLKVTQGPEQSINNHT